MVFLARGEGVTRNLSSLFTITYTARLPASACLPTRRRFSAEAETSTSSLGASGSPISPKPPQKSPESSNSFKSSKFPKLPERKHPSGSSPPNGEKPWPESDRAKMERSKTLPIDPQIRRALIEATPPALSQAAYHTIRNSHSLPVAKPTAIWITNLFVPSADSVLEMMPPSAQSARPTSKESRNDAWVVTFSSHEEALAAAQFFHGRKFKSHDLQSDFHYGDASNTSPFLLRSHRFSPKTTLGVSMDAFRDVSDGDRTLARPYAAVLTGRETHEFDTSLNWYDPRNHDLVKKTTARVRSRKPREMNAPIPLNPPSKSLLGHISPIIHIMNLPTYTVNQDLIDLFGTLVPVRGAFISYTRPREALVEVPTFEDQRTACAFNNYRYGGNYLRVQKVFQHARMSIMAEALQSKGLPFAPSDKLDEYPARVALTAARHRRFIPTFGVPNVWAVQEDEVLQPELFADRPLRHPDTQEEFDWDAFVRDSEPKKVRPRTSEFAL